jgi:hypothetical protein
MATPSRRRLGVAYCEAAPMAALTITQTRPTPPRGCGSPGVNNRRIVGLCCGLLEYDSQHRVVVTAGHSCRAPTVTARPAAMTTTASRSGTPRSTTRAVVIPSSGDEQTTVALDGFARLEAGCHDRRPATTMMPSAAARQ